MRLLGMHLAGQIWHRRREGSQVLANANLDGAEPGGAGARRCFPKERQCPVRKTISRCGLGNLCPFRAACNGRFRPRGREEAGRPSASGCPWIFPDREGGHWEHDAQESLARVSGEACTAIERRIPWANGPVGQVWPGDAPASCRRFCASICTFSIRSVFSPPVE